MWRCRFELSQLAVNSSRHSLSVRWIEKTSVNKTNISCSPYKIKHQRQTTSDNMKSHNLTSDGTSHRSVGQMIKVPKSESFTGINTWLCQESLWRRHQRRLSALVWYFDLVMKQQTLISWKTFLTGFTQQFVYRDFGVVLEVGRQFILGGLHLETNVSYCCSLLVETKETRRKSDT